MEIQKPVTLSLDRFTGYTYILDGRKAILARCNSEAVAGVIVEALTRHEARYTRLLEAARSLCNDIGELSDEVEISEDGKDLVVVNESEQMHLVHKQAKKLAAEIAAADATS